MSHKVRGGNHNIYFSYMSFRSPVMAMKMEMPHEECWIPRDGLAFQGHRQRLERR